MSANNNCMFMGRLASDPETRFSTDGNTAITRFRLAVNRSFKRDGEPDADFLNIVAFGKSAESIGKYFQKGSPILLQTHVQTGSYTNRDGQRVNTTDFVVDAWSFVGSKPENGSERRSAAPERIPENELVPVPKTMEENLPWD